VSEPKKIVITGASSGIGRATAIQLSKSKHDLVLIARREDVLKEVAAECGGATVIAADLSKLDDIPGIVGQIRTEGVYPVLVNAAGTGVFDKYANLDWADIEAQITINELSPMRLIHAILPWMLEEGGGQIVNVLSRVASQVMPGCAAYGASKAGLLMLGNTVAQEYRREGIKVTSLLPGAVDTPIWDGMTGHPDRADMIPVQVVAETIADLIDRPHTHNVDELTLMPTKGIL